MNIRDLIKRYSEIKQARAELTRQDNELKDELAEIESAIMLALDEAGTDSATVRGLGTVFKKTETVPSITDWESFNSSVREQDLLFLFQRRLNASAYRDLLAQGVFIDGVEPVDVTKVSFRKN